MQLTIRRLLTPALALLALAGATQAAPLDNSLSVTLDPAPPLGVGEDTTFIINATPGTLPFLVFSRNPGPINLPIVGQLDLGMPYQIIYLPIVPPTGQLTVPCPLTCDFVNVAPIYSQVLTIVPAVPVVLECKSSQIVLTVDAGMIGDCDGNLVDDDCELETGAPDCDGDGLLDACEDDCDGNQVPDECDAFEDCNGNSVPDQCELENNDCDSDGVPDECEPDSNGDGIPDDCDCPVPQSTCDSGCYDLKNSPTPLYGPPNYGMRLCGLFGDGPDALYTFDFEMAGTSVTLCTDAAAGTITIEGIAYGGLDIGDAWDPMIQGFVRISMVYTGAMCTNGDFGVPISGGGAGEIEWLATGQTTPLVPLARLADQIYAEWETNGGLYPTFHGWLMNGTFDDPTIVGCQGDFESFAEATSQCP